MRIDLNERIIDLVEDFLCCNAVMSQEDYDNILITANIQRNEEDGMPIEELK